MQDEKEIIYTITLHQNSEPYPIYPILQHFFLPYSHKEDSLEQRVHQMYVDFARGFTVCGEKIPQTEKLDSAKETEILGQFFRKHLGNAYATQMCTHGPNQSICLSLCQFLQCVFSSPAEEVVWTIHDNNEHRVNFFITQLPDTKEVLSCTIRYPIYFSTIDAKAEKAVRHAGTVECLYQVLNPDIGFVLTQIGFSETLKTLRDLCKVQCATDLEKSVTEFHKNWMEYEPFNPNGCEIIEKPNDGDEIRYQKHHSGVLVNSLDDPAEIIDHGTLKTQGIHLSMQPSDQFTRDIEYIRQAIESPGTTEQNLYSAQVLKRVIVLMSMGNLQYSRENTWCPAQNSGIPLISFLTHGSSIVVTLPEDSGKAQGIVNFLYGTEDPRWRIQNFQRLGSTHELVCNNGVWREEKLSLFDALQNIFLRLTNRKENHHFGFPIAVGGAKNTNPYRNSIIEANGCHGYLYIYIKYNENGIPIAVLFKLEGAAEWTRAHGVLGGTGHPPTHVDLWGSGKLPMGPDTYRNGISLNLEKVDPEALREKEFLPEMLLSALVETIFQWSNPHDLNLDALFKKPLPESPNTIPVDPLSNVQLPFKNNQGVNPPNQPLVVLPPNHFERNQNSIPAFPASMPNPIIATNPVIWNHQSNEQEASQRQSCMMYLVVVAINVLMWMSVIAAVIHYHQHKRWFFDLTKHEPSSGTNCNQPRSNKPSVLMKS